MPLTKLWPDSLGEHPYASASWVSQAKWQIYDPQAMYLDEDGEPDIAPPLQVLGLSVPASMEWRPFDDRVPQARVSFLPWNDSGIAIATLTVGDEAVVAVMDVAGRTDLHDLQQAGAERRVAAAACVESDFLEFCPRQPLIGIPQTLTEALKYRRLAAGEFTSAARDVHSITRTPAIFPMLGLRPAKLKSLTLNVCLPRNA